jgi:hypothetical protein
MLLPIRACAELHCTDPTLLDSFATPSGYRVTRYRLPLETIPADFFADPDGRWTYDALIEAARFVGQPGVAIGALRRPFRGHPDGAAVVTLNAESRPYIAIVECPIAYELVRDDERSGCSAA